MIIIIKKNVRLIIIRLHYCCKLILKIYCEFMETQNYNCKKCGLTVSSICSKCDRVVDVKVLDNGCIVQKTKCSDCANVPVIKDVCSQK